MVNEMETAIKNVANRYEVISLIGQGGMADVYQAKDTILNRIVAVKVLREKLSEDAMTLVRFQREASAASRLSHPNVVDIYDVGEYEGMHYIVMEYVRGRTLKQLISSRGALSVTESIHIMTQLTSAVQHAHLHKIIHRDIKPQNVLVKDDGSVKITDFGIAIANDAVQLTLNNAVMGSAHYLAPETAKGEDATEQVDIYSLGIVFYELLTGDVPFHGKTPTEIAVKHLRQPIDYVRDYNPAIPQSVENIILKATAKNPKDRYENAGLMLYDLEHCMDWEYRNMERIKVDVPTISKVDVNNGHVKVEYVTESEPVKEKKKYTGYLSPISIGIISVIVILLSFLITLVTGVVRIDGVMGYEKMPSIVELSQQEAEEILQDNNFNNFVFKEVISDSVDAGYVISANYESGSLIKSNSRVVVEVSKGPSYLIKDYTGQYLADVEQEFLNEGVHIEIEYEYSNAADTNPGIILEQRHLKPGDRIDPDSEESIYFIVSQYPTIVIPEDIVGMNVDDAKDQLNELGIAVVTRKMDSGMGSGIVVMTDPATGTTYTQEGSDSVVTLYYD